MPDTGLGHVTAGGDPFVARLSGTVTLHKLAVGAMSNNAYLLVGPDACVLIDAAAEPTRLRALLADHKPTAIITTHRHHDHIGGLRDLADTGAELIAGTPDCEAITAATGMRPRGVWDGDTIEFGSEHLEVIGIVGHTPGSITLVYRGDEVHLFTGDSLFPGGPGRTWGKRDFRSLMADLESKIFGRFADSAHVHPGHGDDTTLGAERPHLAEWHARGW